MYARFPPARSDCIVAALKEDAEMGAIALTVETDICARPFTVPRDWSSTPSLMNTNMQAGQRTMIMVKKKK